MNRSDPWPTSRIILFDLALSSELDVGEIRIAKVDIFRDAKDLVASSGNVVNNRCVRSFSEFNIMDKILSRYA
jgi:hypothetical protein